MNEFDLIKNYFAVQMEKRPDVAHGIGDDAAIVNIPSDMQLAITTDTLVAGVHFPIETVPYDIGYKALAVNLSDLAAMGATPAWVTMALTLPENDETWLQSFCEGFFTLANRHQVALIGGDLTRGPLSITIQAMGFVPNGQALLRSSAKPGDLIYVTGTLGDAGLGLAVIQEHLTLPREDEMLVKDKLHQPEPRIASGIALRNLANAAIDISDGLAADVGHILEESRVGAIIYVDQLPFSDAVLHALRQEEAVSLALSAGDDYELCFTVPPEHQKTVEEKLASIPCRYTHIGEITQQSGLVLRYSDGKTYHGLSQGYKHF